MFKLCSYKLVSDYMYLEHFLQLQQGLHLLISPFSDYSTLGFGRRNI